MARIKEERTEYNAGAPTQAKVEPPNYTQVPNRIFELMPEMDKSELKVVMAVCRQTFGWHKAKDRLTITVLMEITGLSRQAVYDGVEAAKARGLLIQEETKQLGYVYSLDVIAAVSNEETESVQPVDTLKKEKEIQQKDESEEANGYAAYAKAFGELAEAPTSRNLLAMEEVEHFPREYIDESFRRTAARERASGQRWRQYQRIPYALQLMNDWAYKGGIQPEPVAKAPPPKNAPRPTSGTSWDNMKILS